MTTTTPVLETVTYVRLPVDDEGDIERVLRDQMERPLRWHPPCRDDIHRPGHAHRGYTSLARLLGGEALSPEQLAEVRRYCTEAIEFYASNPWGDSEMRELEPVAIAEFEGALQIIGEA